MLRWFPALALLCTVLWAVAAGSLVAGSSSRTAGARADWAALATLLAHLAALGRLGAGRIRRPGGRGPGWVQVQEAKHRRKGAWFAGWGLAVLGAGWLAGRWGEGSATGRPGPAAWFGVALNLGFQPGMLVAGWAALAARVRLGRSAAG